VRGILALSLVTLALGCGRPSPSAGTADAGAVRTTAATIEVDAGFVSAAAELAPSATLAPPAPEAAGARPLASASTAGQAVDVVSGTFKSGSMPGDDGRVASVEPALIPVEMRAFAIDALPYPNDPTATPELASSQADAARMCNERGARLCTELEWERACKGPDEDRYATGATWDPACDRSPSRCASGFGARGMGFVPEWTDSVWSGESSSKTAVVRGGPASAHRCAARSRATAKGMPSRMAFRCCHGERNGTVIAPIETKTAFRKTELDAADLAKIFASVPELARISEGVRLFGEPDVKSIVMRSGASADGITFASSPILWSPEPGIELLVATGRAKKTSFVVALWPLPEGNYRFASAFLLLGDLAPVALAYEPSRRKELRWTTCWGCAGEQGAVSLRDDGRVVIVQY
jgi:formylglycine-generating enzyme required for sulfatase activity